MNETTNLYNEAEPIYTPEPQNQEAPKKDNTGKIAAAAGGFVAGAAVGATGGVMAANSGGSDNAIEGDAAKVNNVTTNVPSDGAQVMQQTVTNGDQVVISKQEIHTGPNGEQVITSTQEIHNAPKADQVVFVSQNTTKQTVVEQPAVARHEVHEIHTVETIVTDDNGIRFAQVQASNFSDAFAQARAALGPGGAFEYNGKVYGTYYRHEWNEMSRHDRLAFQHEAVKLAPSHHHHSENIARVHHDHHHHEHHHHHHHYDVPNVSEPAEQSSLISYHHGDIPFAQVNAHNFSDAFAQARAQVGAGGAFEYNGKVYSTYYRHEWKDMSHDDRLAFQRDAVQQASGHYSHNYNEYNFASNDDYNSHDHDSNLYDLDSYGDDNGYNQDEVKVLGVEPADEYEVMNASFANNDDQQSLVVELDNDGQLDVSPVSTIYEENYVDDSGSNYNDGADYNNYYADNQNYDSYEEPSYNEEPSYDNFAQDYDSSADTYEANDYSAGNDMIDNNYDFDDNVMSV